MPDSPRAVFFDLVGTLIRSTQPIGEQYAARARRHGASGANSELMSLAFRRAMQAAPPMAFPHLATLDGIAAAERSWWRAVVGAVVAECGLETALAGERFERFFADLYDHFTTAKAWETYPDACSTLDRLRGQNLIVGLITNYDTRVYPVLAALGLSGRLDSITIPALAGAAKPDPAIFTHALSQHGLAPSQAIYVGDEREDDYEGAESAGMRAILIDREGRCEGTGARRVGSLAELTIGD